MRRSSARTLRLWPASAWPSANLPGRRRLHAVRLRARHGGPFFIWGVPILLGGQLLVALVFSELPVELPLARSLHQWARRLVGPRYGWFVGWAYGRADRRPSRRSTWGPRCSWPRLMGWPLTGPPRDHRCHGRHRPHDLQSQGLRGTMIVTWLGVAISDSHRPPRRCAPRDGPPSAVVHARLP